MSQHHISARGLLSLLVGKDIGCPITLENIIEDCIHNRDRTAEPRITMLNGDSSESQEVTIAKQLLQSLDEVGYQIVRKDTPAIPIIEPDNQLKPLEWRQYHYKAKVVDKEGVTHHVRGSTRFPVGDSVKAEDIVRSVKCAILIKHFESGIANDLDKVTLLENVRIDG